jgi:hypothetical protein
MPIYLSIYQSIYLTIYLSIYLSIYLFVFRYKSNYADNSITQAAMIDDDNLSQAITHGGGGITLHSRSIDR